MKQRKSGGFELSEVEPVVWRLEDRVTVELQQWIPHQDPDGNWKDIGRSLYGILVSGQDSVINGGSTWHVKPLDNENFNGTIAPVTFTGEAFDPYGAEPILQGGEPHPQLGRFSLRFVVSLEQDAS